MTAAPLRRTASTQAAVFAGITALHLPALAAAAQERTLAAFWIPALSFLLWSALSAAGVRAARRGSLVPAPLIALVLCGNVLSMTATGVLHPSPGFLASMAVAMAAMCAITPLLTGPRPAAVVLAAAVVGQVVLVRAAAGYGPASSPAPDIATTVLSTVAMTATIVHLDRRRRSALGALAVAAVTDPLTGLLNRRGMAERFAGVRRRDGWVAALVLDVDHFKRINDVHGHDVGDLVLRAVSGALRACARDDDVLVRLGGEELAWLAAWPDAAAATAAAERLRGEVARATARAGHPVTASIGVAVLPAGGRPVPGATDEAVLSHLLTTADDALYAAKRGGRDRVEVSVR